MGTVSGADALGLRTQFLEQNFDQNCWAGFDLGEISDLTSYVLIFPRATIGGETTEAVTAIPYFWMPEYGLLDKEKLWGVPLSSWVREGWIKLIDGDMTDDVRNRGYQSLRSHGRAAKALRTYCAMPRIETSDLGKAVVAPEQPGAEMDGRESRVGA